MPAALAALDELVATDLLSATDVARRYRFRHPIVRRAVYESAGEGWRLGAHARAAAELERRGGSLAARAHHVERCAVMGDEAAGALLVAAGHEAAARAPAGAIRWFDAALRLMPDRGGDRLSLLVPLATALAATGQLERALATLLDALALVPPELAELRVRARRGVRGVREPAGAPSRRARAAAAGAGRAARRRQRRGRRAARRAGRRRALRHRLRGDGRARGYRHRRPRPRSGIPPSARSPRPCCVTPATPRGTSRRRSRPAGRPRRHSTRSTTGAWPDDSRRRTTSASPSTSASTTTTRSGICGAASPFRAPPARVSSSRR